jgi:hypothetical protein
MRFPKQILFPRQLRAGMAFTLANAEHDQRYEAEQVRASQVMMLALANGDYGLLSDPEFVVTKHLETVQITLKSCRAILLSGHRVEILPHLPTPTIHFTAQKGIQYNLYIDVHFDIKMPIDAVFPQSYWMSEVVLKAMPSEVNLVHDGQNCLKIAEWQDEFIENFVPATLLLSGNKRLRTKHTDFYNQMNEIVTAATYLFRDFQGIQSTFCGSIVTAILAKQGSYQLQLKQSPSVWLASFVDLAGVVKASLLINNKGLLNQQLKQGQIDDLSDAISSLLSSDSTAGITVMIDKISIFLNILLKTFQNFQHRGDYIPQSRQR